MLIEQENPNEFISILKKKLTNFCKKAPTFLSFRVTSEKVKIVDGSISRFVRRVCWPSLQQIANTFLPLYASSIKGLISLGG